MWGWEGAGRPQTTGSLLLEALERQGLGAEGGAPDVPSASACLLVCLAPLCPVLTLCWALDGWFREPRQGPGSRDGAGRPQGSSLPKWAGGGGQAGVLRGDGELGLRLRLAEAASGAGSAGRGERSGMPEDACAGRGQGGSCRAGRAGGLGGGSDGPGEAAGRPPGLPRQHPDL